MTSLTTRKRSYSRINTTISQESETANKRHAIPQDNVIVKQEDSDDWATHNDSILRYDFLTGETPLRYFYLGLVAGEFCRSHERNTAPCFHVMSLPFLYSLLKRCQAHSIKIRCKTLSENSNEYSQQSIVRWTLDDEHLDETLASVGWTRTSSLHTAPEKLADLFYGNGCRAKSQQLFLSFFFGWLASNDNALDTPPQHTGTGCATIILHATDASPLTAMQGLFKSFGWTSIKLRLNTTAVTASENPKAAYQLEIPLQENLALLKHGLELLDMERIPLDRHALQLKAYMASPNQSRQLSHSPLSTYENMNFSDFIAGQSSHHQAVARDFYDQPLEAINEMLLMAGMAPLESTTDLDIAIFIDTIKATAGSRSQDDKMKLLEEYLHCHGNQVMIDDDVIEKTFCPFDGCGLSFMSQSGMRVHIRAIHKNQQFACTFDGCEEIFHNKFYMIMHVKAVHEKQKLACTVQDCKRIFMEESTLQQHIRDDHQKIRIACTFKGCEKVFKTKIGRFRHYNVVHENHQRFPCTFDGCEKTFAQKHYIQHHLASAHGQQEFDCTADECHMVFTVKRDLDQHVKLSHNGCTVDGCNKIFNDEPALKEHVQTHEIKKFVCTSDDCHQRYSSKISLARHIKSVHENKRYPCTFEDCKKEFLSKTGMLRHVESKHENQKYTCTFEGCGKAFTQNGHMKMHVKVAHQNYRFPCTFEGCQSTFLKKLSLEQHVSIFHKNEKVRCIVEGCRKVFSINYTMRLHVKSMHERQRVACPFEGCTKDFSAKSTMRLHYKFVHKNIGVVCTFDGCEEVFSNKANMLRHVGSTHENQKYPCTIEGCDTTFRTEDSMNIHLKSSHEN